MVTRNQQGDGWTLVLRRQPAWIVDGAPEGGFTADFELICCDCGDDPGLDYREIQPRLQLVRGPYTIAAGVAAYEQHCRLHQQLRATCRPRPNRTSARLASADATTGAKPPGTQ